MTRFVPVLSAFFSFLLLSASVVARAESPGMDEDAVSYPDETLAEPQSSKRPKHSPLRGVSRADGFIAKADWEFDGFVAGGQDQAVRSMFYLNDLIYLNIGSDQGVEPGSRIVIYKRGNRVRDPQTGRSMGYEVRRAAISRATDQVDDKTCSVRILNTYEAVEIGDLVRRE